MTRDESDKLAAAYREPREAEGKHPRASEQPPVASSLAYIPEVPRDASSVRALYGALVPMFVGAVVAGATQSGVYGMMVCVLGWAAAYFRRRHARGPRALLRVDSARLLLSGRAFPVEQSCDLEELLDVYLDTEIKVQSMDRTGLVGTTYDKARIAMRFRRTTYFLTEEGTSHLDASEWLSKIRRFLRGHGWVPEDERSA